MKVVFASIVALSMIACGSEETAGNVEAVIVPETEEVIETPEVIEEVVEVKSQYELDFETFKTAVQNKDIPGVGAFASSDAIDSEAFLMFFEDQAFTDQLMKMSYSDLTSTDVDGITNLEGSVMVSSSEDGNDMESAIILYFTEGETSLEFDAYNVAG